MRILILGGTGAMGQYLSALLSKQSNDIFVTTRKERKNYGSLRYIVGDAHSEDFLLDLLSEKYDVIVDFMSYNSEEFARRVDALLSNCGQYIFLSSCRVYADVKGAITEDSPRLLDVCKDVDYLKTDEYALSKARQENMLRDSGRKNWTVVRPPKTYGEGRLQLGSLEKEDWLSRALNGKSIIFCSEIATRRLHLTNGYDVARAIAKLVGDSIALGETFHITTDQSITWGEVLDIYLEELEQYSGKRPEVKMVGLNQFMKFSPSKYQLKYSTLLDREFDNRKIAQFIDTANFISPKDGLKKYLRLFLEKPYFSNRGRGVVARQNIAVGEGKVKDYCILLVIYLLKIFKV